MEPKAKKKNPWYGKIESREEALKLIKDTSMGFYVIAAIQAGIGVFLAPSMLLDGAIFAVLGFLLRKFKSRVAAIILLVLSAFGIFVTAGNLVSESPAGGTNIILSLLVFWAAARAVQATFALRKFK